MMKAKEKPPYALVSVRMPLDLHGVLETLAAEKGETLSVVVRDLVRAAAVEARRVDHGVTPATAKACR
jgi:predicted DNA-binding protein